MSVRTTKQWKSIKRGPFCSLLYTDPFGDGLRATTSLRQANHQARSLHNKAPFMSSSVSASKIKLPVFLSAIETAIHLGLSAADMEKMRRESKGPKYYRLDVNGGGKGKILYRLDEVETWQREAIANSQSSQTKSPAIDETLLATLLHRPACK